METVTVILALIIGAIGLALLAFLLHAILSPLVGNPLKFSEQWKLKRRARLLGELERLLEEGATDGATNYLRQCFYLEHVYRNPDLIPIIATHNLSILGSALTLADRRGAHIQNLPIVEELLNDRIQLMKSYLETTETKREIARKRKEEGKEVPGWAAKEYGKKIHDLKDRIQTNHTSLRKELEALFKALEGSVKSSEATYH
jgi:hypothetical protein